MAVGLQDAGEVAQMSAGMFALAIRCVGESDSCGFVLTGRTIIAHISPAYRWAHGHIPDAIVK